MAINETFRKLIIDEISGCIPTPEISEEGIEKPEIEKESIKNEKPKETIAPPQHILDRFGGEVPYNWIDLFAP